MTDGADPTEYPSAEPPEETMVDIISGREIPAGPEERLRQQWVEDLITERGFERGLIRTIPEWRIPRRPSMDRQDPDAWRTDVAVFDDPDHLDDKDHVDIVVETKSEETYGDDAHERAIDQVENYLHNEQSARIGVAVSDEETPYKETILVKNFDEGKPWFKKHLGDLPYPGTEIGGSEPRTIGDLEPLENAQKVTQEIRDYIHSKDTSATDDLTMLTQWSYMVLTKRADEQRGENRPPEFRARPGETDRQVAERVDRLFRDRVVRDHPAVFGHGADPDEIEIELDDHTKRRIVELLQDHSLDKTPSLLMRDAFEVFITGAVKGDEGQFFTRRNLCKGMVRALAPDRDETLGDLAAGTGGFLWAATEHVGQRIEEEFKERGQPERIEPETRRYLEGYVYAVDKAHFAVNLMKAELEAMGPTTPHVVRGDSLNYENWPKQKKELPFGQFNYLFANFPYGSGLTKDDPETLEGFELGHIWDEQEDGTWEKTNEVRDQQEIAILFMELYYKALDVGGRAAVVFPETHLVTDDYVAHWIRDKFRVLGVWDLPDVMFQPHTHAKMVVLFLEKTEGGQRDTDYPIFLGTVEKVGHNQRGDPLYKEDENYNTVYDEDGNPVRDDEIPPMATIFRDFLNREKSDWQPDTSGTDLSSSQVTVVKNSEIEEDLLLPRYYQRREIERVKEWADEHDCVLVQLQDLIEEGVVEVHRGHGGVRKDWYGPDKEIPYLRTSNVSGLEVTTRGQHIKRLDRDIYEAKKDKVEVQPWDILFVKRGDYRIGNVGIVYPSQVPILTVAEVDILRVNTPNDYGLTPGVLLYLLSQDLVSDQLERMRMYETIIWNVKSRYHDLYLPIPTKKKFREEIDQAVKARGEAYGILNEPLDDKVRDIEQEEIEGQEKGQRGTNGEQRNI